MIDQKLLQTIESYIPFEDTDRQARIRIFKHIQAGGLLFDRTRWDGHLTGSAFVLNAQGTHMLLLYHRKLQRWLQPGGHGEPYEQDPKKIALRETQEETGLGDLIDWPEAPSPFDMDVHTIAARAEEPAHEHLDIRYLLRAPQGAQPHLNTAESQGFRWVEVHQATRAEMDPSVARAARKILRFRLRVRFLRRALAAVYRNSLHSCTGPRVA